MRFVLLMILSLTLLYSATIQGEIYNANNNKHLNNTLISVENLKGDIIIQKFFNEKYQLDVDSGTYTMRAYHYSNGSLDYYVEDKFQTTQKSMQLDLLLIPYELQKLTPGFKPPSLVNESDVNKQILQQGKSGSNNLGNTNTVFYSMGILLALIIVLAYFIYTIQKQKKEKIENKKEENKIHEKMEKQMEVQNKRRSKEKEKTSEVEEKYELDEDSLKVLKILKENEGRMLQKEIRDILNFSETKMSLIITELEVDGFIRKIKKGRKNILKLKNPIFKRIHRSK